jgi:hypothetical protein
MNADIKQRWLDALRSGKYRQGSRVLRSESNKYCCLGILCELVDPTGWRRVPVPSLSGMAYEYVTGESHNMSMPSLRTLDSAGLDAEIAEQLARWNDDGMSFSDIAKYIEEVA